MDDALRHLKRIRRVFNRSAVERHLMALRSEVADLEAAWRRSGGDDGTLEHKRYSTAVRRLRNDEICWQAVKKQMPVPADDMPDGIWQYVPAYRVQEISGRISEIGGGFQSCTREMKHAAIQDVPGIRNYDIVSSQLYGLKEEFENAGITTRQIDALIARPKTELAAEAGVSVDVWKRSLYAVIFHAALHDSFKAALCAAERCDGQMPAVAKEVLEGVGKRRAAHVYDRIRGALLPLHEDLNTWHEYLVTEYWDSVRQPGKGWYARNDCGIVFRLDDHQGEHDRKSAMAAWLLQGKEAAFIHRLTLLSDEYDYEVIANEHDGLLIIGEIPLEAIETALDRASFKYAKLAKKPFVNHEEVSDHKLNVIGT